MIRQRTDYYILTPSQVIGEFVAMDILKKTSEDNLIRAKFLSQRSSLALKANVTPTSTPSEAPQQEEVENTGSALPPQASLLTIWLRAGPGAAPSGTVLSFVQLLVNSASMFRYLAFPFGPMSRDARWQSADGALPR